MFQTVGAKFRNNKAARVSSKLTERLFEWIGVERCSRNQVNQISSAPLDHLVEGAVE